MMTSLISGEELQRWSDALLKRALGGVKLGEMVVLVGEHMTEPLLRQLSLDVIKAGGFPEVRIKPSWWDRSRNWGTDMVRFGTHEQIQTVPPVLDLAMDKMAKYVEILGFEDKSALQDLPTEHAQMLAKASMPQVMKRLGKPWLLTPWWTEHEAKASGMTLEQMAKLVIDCCMADHDEMARQMAPVLELMQAMKKARVVSKHPDGRELVLEMTFTAGQIPELCDGRKNFPDGETYTCPDANSVNGEIFFDVPVEQQGVLIGGIYLSLKDGEIVDFSAETGGDKLTEIIETDAGSHRMGEFAIGSNPSLTRVVQNALLVEKMWGTMHMAIGMSYDDRYGDKEGEDKLFQAALKAGKANMSAVHVDIVSSAREDGAIQEVWLGDTRLVLDGKIWVPAT